MGPWLPLIIGFVACLYAAVGHAGATGYIAVMSLAGLPPEVIRPTALMLNVVVSLIATVQFARAGHFRGGLFLPLAAASIPAALLGGWLRLPTAVFEALVGGVLLLSVGRLMKRLGAGDPLEQPGWLPRPPGLAALGGGLGFLSGLTGVGGGVFLTPALLALEVAPVRQVAAVSAPFILVNSLAGLGGWFARGNPLPAVGAWVVLAVGLGGVVGAQLGAFQLPPRRLQVLMAVVLVIAGVKLVVRAVVG